MIGVIERSLSTPKNEYYDRGLVWCTLLLLMINVIMVTSASVAIFDDATFFYTKRVVAHIIVASIVFAFVLSIPVQRWQQYSSSLLFFTILCLIFVLLFSPTINGATRWISLGFFNFQPAEVTKFAFFCYLSSYLSRRIKEVQGGFWGFIKPIMLLFVLSLLLLKQPDLGTVIVLFAITLGLLFIAGAKMWQFLAIIGVGITTFLMLILFESYRLKRLTTFLNPWEDQYNTGYQLTNSLMAIGNGGVLGQGLGNSVRKLGYLPEAHTDFIFAIIAEELGYVGCIVILLAIFFIALKAMLVGRAALQLGQRFSGYLACQIGLWFSFQALVNVGVTSGLLPTKGLTLPLVSYGGSSAMIMLIAIAVLLRTDFENRQIQTQARTRRNKNNERKTAKQ